MEKVKVVLLKPHGRDKEGDTIECHPNLLKHLIANGKIAEDAENSEPKKEKKVTEPKKEKKK